MFNAKLKFVCIDLCWIEVEWGGEAGWWWCHESHDMQLTMSGAKTLNIKNICIASMGYCILSIGWSVCQSWFPKRTGSYSTMFLLALYHFLSPSVFPRSLWDLLIFKMNYWGVYGLWPTYLHNSSCFLITPSHSFISPICMQAKGTVCHFKVNNLYLFFDIKRRTGQLSSFLPT